MRLIGIYYLFISIYICFKICFTSSQWHQLASNTDMVLPSRYMFQQGNLNRLPSEKTPMLHNLQIFIKVLLASTENRQCHKTKAKQLFKKKKKKKRRLLLDCHKYRKVCSQTNTLNKALFLQYGSRKTLVGLVHLERVK